MKKYGASYAVEHITKIAARTKRAALNKLRRKHQRRLVAARITDIDPDDEADRADGDLLWP